MNRIYLDNNATTALLPQVAEAMYASYQAGFMNPASPHAEGRRAQRALESAKERLAERLGCRLSGGQPDRVILTSGGTEANNLALLGLIGSEPGRVLISAIEHPSIREPAERLAQLGWEIVSLPVNGHGVVPLDAVRERLTPDVQLVSIMAANNETGVVQPIEEISLLCQQTGVPLHTDAVQVVGKLPVDFRRWGVTALTLSAHKFHGPRGIGALLLRGGVTLRPHTLGGAQQLGSRPGTECVTLAEGLSAALEHWLDSDPDRADRLRRLRDHFEQRLLAELPDLVINGSGAARVPHTSNLALPGLDRQALLMALDMAGVACSTGSACASGSSDPSPVLLAMGLPRPVVEASLRFSLSALTTLPEVDEAVDRILRVVKHLRRHDAGGKSAVTSRHEGPKPI